MSTRDEILRLDVVELGEPSGTEPATSGEIGMNVDARCSTTDAKTHACRREPGGVASWHSDGDGGIDNAFGRAILPLLRPFDPAPSAGASGTSFLAFEGEGRATLYLGTRSGHVRAVIPLTDVRLDDGPRGLVTLAAIIPRDAFVDTMRSRANALLDEPSFELCSGSALEAVLATVRQAADVTLASGGDPSVACDGISIGLRFRATPAAKTPDLLPACDGTR